MPRIPKGEFTSRGATLSVRITKDTRSRLDKAARNSGNSLTAEVEARLRGSFAKDDDAIVVNFGHAQTFALLRLAAEAIKHVEALTGARWDRNRFTYDAAAEAMATVLRAFRPRGTKVPPTTFPVMAALDADPVHRDAVRMALRNKPWGAVVARTCIALTQAARDSTGDFGVYRKIGARLGGRITKPVLPLPKTAKEEAHNARITRSARGETK
jgi:uncharacterized protein (DUF1778 family)